MYEPITRGLLRTIIGRSSDLSIHTLLHLPGNYPPVTLTILTDCGKRLLSYSDEFVQDLHLLPFSPNQTILIYSEMRKHFS